MASALPTKDDHPITDEGLAQLLVAVLTKKDGDPWSADAIAQYRSQLYKIVKWHAGLDDGCAPDKRTYGDLFLQHPVNMINDFVADEETTAGPGCIKQLAEMFSRVIHLLEPESGHVPLLEELMAHADQASAERSQASAESAPHYSEFLRNKTVQLWCKGMRADATVKDVSIMVYCLIEVAVTGGRSGSLRNLKCYHTDSFDVEDIHKKTDNCAPPASVLVSADGKPEQLILGWSPESTGTQQKNGKFVRIDLTPILPDAEHLMPLVVGNLTSLCKGLEDGDLVLRQNEKGKPFGRDTLPTRFKATFGYTIDTDKITGRGGLRKAIENRRRELLEFGEIDVAASAEVHRREQHGAQVANQKYSAPPKKARHTIFVSSDSSDSDSDTGEPENDHGGIEAPDSDDAAPIITVKDVEALLNSRKEELTISDTGRGWALLSAVKPMPIAEVMSILINAYTITDINAPLTTHMITDINWLESDRGTTDFRASATPQDNIPGQLVAVLNGTALPELRRDYPYLDMTCDPPVQRNTQYYVRGYGRDSRENGANDSDDTDSTEPAEDTGTTTDDGTAGPAMRGLLAAFAAAYESDTKRIRR